MATSLNAPATAAIVARANALFDDLSFTSAREWKAAKPGRKVIGYMPIYVPREIIHAADMLPLGIVGGGDQLEVIHGDAYYQSYICRIPRSTIELGVSGRIDFVDGMLFPSICDVIRNLSGMWKMMFPHVYSHYFDVPQNYRDDIGGNFYVNETGRAAARSRRAARQADHRRRASALDRGLQREPPAGARSLRLPGGEAVAGARGGSLSDDTRRSRAPGRGAHRHAARLSCRGARRGTADARQLPHRADRHVLRAAAAQFDQVAGIVRLLRGRRRSPAGHPLAHRRRRDRGRSAAESFGCLPASFRVDGGQVRAQSEGKGPASGPRGQAHRRGRRDFRRAELLRSGAARAADAAARAQGSRHPLHRVQIRRELRPDAADPGTGRHLRRIRSNCGAQHDDADKDCHLPRAGEGGRQGRFHGEAEGDDGRALRSADQRARDRRQGGGHFRARQSQRTAHVLRPPEQSAGGQCHPERAAPHQRQLRAGSGKDRPFRRRLHLCEVGHRHDGQGQSRAQRQEIPQSRRAAACPTPAASPS